MNLELDPRVAEGYKSPSQVARVVSETWAGENMYCPACLNNSLDKTKTNKAVLDFTCPNCNEGYQLKSKKSPFGKKVSNSAYQPKIDAIHSGNIPNFTFLQYDSDEWLVKELFIVPSHFMTESIVEKRKPLPQGAKRSGWVGSNILLGNLARDAKIPIVDDGEPLPKETVKKRWKQFEFMQNQTAESRGWLSDILMCVRRINQENFTLKQIYEFEDKLSKLHPKNKHIRAKIRQQLQVLRDKNIIEFIGDGWYQVKSQKKLREG